MSVLPYLLEKEFKQFMRNAILPRIALVVPLMVMLVAPLVTTMDVRDVRVAVVDHDRTVASRRMADKVAASPYFTLVARPTAYAGVLRLIEDGRADIVLTIPAGYGRDLGSGRAAPRVQITANAVNAAKAQIGASYLSQLTAAQSAPTDGRRLAVQYRYNPTLDYRAYMIPALMTLLLLILCGVLPALNIVSEKEIGTIEQINVTPVGRLAFTMGKLIPFWAIGLVAVGVGIAVGGLVYGVWPAGSLWLILLASLLFTSVVSGFGLVVSNYSTTLRQALFVIYFFVMIFILMGGLFTPVASMPRWAQAVTYALPTRYYGEAMRALYLKGSTLADLLPQFGALALMAAGLGAWAVGSYRKTE
ncbi:MAG TPA: ABC transporter permease [Candidatus Caccomonas pullistercoris]|nr:ABC transporter permease [Candidatus Caccomonas pullistercoris]